MNGHQGSNLRGFAGELALNPQNPHAWTIVRRYPLELARFLPGQDAGIAIVRGTVDDQVVATVLVGSCTAVEHVFILTDLDGVPVLFWRSRDAKAVIDEAQDRGTRHQRKRQGRAPISSVHAKLPLERGFDWCWLSPYDENVMFPLRRVPQARILDPELVEEVVAGVSLRDGLRLAALACELNADALAASYRQGSPPQTQADLLTRMQTEAKADRTSWAAKYARSVVLLQILASRIMVTAGATPSACIAIISDILPADEHAEMLDRLTGLNARQWVNWGARTLPAATSEIARRLFVREMVERVLDQFPWLWAALQRLRCASWRPEILYLPGGDVREALSRERLDKRWPADLDGLLDGYAFAWDMPRIAR